MVIDEVLRKLGRLESSLSELYAWYSEVFEKDPEIAFAFFKMSAEEKGHASLVDYQKRMAQPEAALDTDVPIDVAEIESALGAVKRLRAPATPPTVAEPLRETLLLERSAAECHYKNALKEANPKLAGLLHALGGEDRLHVARIEEIARRRCIVFPEAAGPA